MQAEVIGKGTYQGSLDYSDYSDWYKVEGMGDHEVTVTASLKDPNYEDGVSVTSVNEYGLTDNQVGISLFEGYEKDTCHWKDESERGHMFLMVDGVGEYELKIEWGDSDEGGFLFSPFCWVLGFGIALAIALVVALIVYFTTGSKWAGEEAAKETLEHLDDK
jgi:hypothetical protein